MILNLTILRGFKAWHWIDRTVEKCEKITNYRKNIWSKSLCNSCICYKTLLCVILYNDNILKLKIDLSNDQKTIWEDGKMKSVCEL